MKRWRFGTALALVATLSSCGGGGGGGSGGGGNPPTGSVPPPPPPPTASACSLSARQNWALAQMREWYLFPETLPANPNPAAYSSVEDFIDALTATARAQRRDRYFTYLTSIAEENAFFNSGSSAGFGVRFSYDSVQNRVFVQEAFEGAPALAAGIDRGTELLAVGTNSGNLQLVSNLMASGGAQAVSDALGPTNPGVTRLLRISNASGTREVSVTKADYELTPVSSRYGAKIIDEGGRKYGYVNLRTFINTADSPLRSAFASFKAQGVTDIIVDVRYNGGGLVSIAELIGDLMGANRTASEVFSFTTFRPEKSSNNDTRFFRPAAQSVAPTRIAFIGTGGSASASELIITPSSLITTTAPPSSAPTPTASRSARSGSTRPLATTASGSSRSRPRMRRARAIITTAWPARWRRAARRATTSPTSSATRWNPRPGRPWTSSPAAPALPSAAAAAASPPRR